MSNAIELLLSKGIGKKLSRVRELLTGLPLRAVIELGLLLKANTGT